MLETRTQGNRSLDVCPLQSRAAQWNTRKLVAGLAIAAAMLAIAAPMASAQTAQTATTPTATVQRSRIGTTAPVTYNNKWELFGGLSYMNFQAGQSLPKLMNLGGGEVLGTYWVTPKLGVGAEWRGVWGTTPVLPNSGPPTPSHPNGSGFNGRALVELNGVLGGVQYRVKKNQYAALGLHALGGVAAGNFTRTNFGSQDAFNQSGLYTNRTSPLFALGGSIDINFRKRFAYRLSPDLILERFGTETREFFGISGGIVWRIDKH